MNDSNLINDIGPYNPGAAFNPLDLPTGEDPVEIQHVIDGMLDEMSQLSGAAAINFYMGVLAPEQMLLQQALVMQFSNQMDDLTNYTYFISTLQQEINLSKPDSDKFHDYTADLRVQIDQLLQAIPNDPRITSDQKDSFLKPLETIKNIIDTKSLPDIWNEATNPTNPNQKDLSDIFKSLDQLSSTSTSLSSTMESSTRYYMGEYNKYASLLKNMINSTKSVGDNIVKHIKN